MLIRVEDMSAICGTGLNMQNAFVIGDQIIGVGFDLNQPWAMYAIDTRTFRVRKIPVLLKGINNDSWIRMQQAVVVYNDIAYAWFHNEARMAAGTIENDGFHWKYVQTKGAPDGIMHHMRKVTYREGPSPNFAAVFHNIRTDGYYLWRLDLTTLEWTSVIEIAHKLVLSELHQIISIWDTTDKVHFISERDERGSRHHMIMDRNTSTWTTREIQETTYNIYAFYAGFKALGQLYTFGYFGGGTALFRFNAAQNEWNKVFHYGYRETGIIVHETSEVVVSGSRVFLLECIGAASLWQRELKRLSKLYVFELEPTLFDRAQAVVLRNEICKEIGRTCLPRTIVDTLSRDTRGDELVKRRQHRKRRHS